jgi:peptidoglycan hydrolase-like protein with peptidoglycan-binding domain
MSKRTAIISILVLLLICVGFGAVNILMGKPGFLTDKMSINKKEASTSGQASSDANQSQASASGEDDYSYVSLDRVLKEDMSGDDVKKVQYILKKKGLYKGEITGDFNDELKSAVKQFQKDNEIDDSGVVNMDTISLLEGVSLEDSTEQLEDTAATPSPAEEVPEYMNVEITRDLYPGYTGDDVKKVQYILKKAGYYDGEITGEYSEKTKEAVLKLQKEKSIRLTGNVGKLTLAALKDL